jgi:hypothetical protein
MSLKESALLALASMLAISSCASTPAEGWLYVATNSDGAKFYIDTRSVTATGRIVQATELADYPDDGSNWRSMTSVVLYNCDANTSSVLRSSFFSGRMSTGKLTFTREGVGKFKPPVVGQPSGALNQTACKAAGVGPNNSFKPKPLRGSA